MSRTALLILAVVLALGACGDDSNRKIADAPPGHQDDAQIDAPSSTSPVTVTVSDGSTPTQGWHVYFQANDSTVISEATTDTAGTASAMMPNGGFVTVVSEGVMPSLGGPSFSYDLVTWAGVKPGDHLVLTNSSRSSMTETVTVVLPGYAGHTIGSYDVYSTCGTSRNVPPSAVAATQATLSTFGCNGTADMLIVVKDASSVIIGSFSVVGQVITDGDTINYAAKTFVASTSRVYTLSNNPDVLDIDVQDTYQTPHGVLFAPESSLLATGNPAMARANVPGLPANGLDVVAAAQNGPNTERELLAWGTTGDFAIDWGAQQLPDFTADPVTFDAATHKLAWTTTGGTATADFSGAYTFGSNNIGAFWGWKIFGPTTTSLTFPTLPTDVSDFNYTSVPDVSGLVTAKVPGGYDAIRATVGAGLQPTGATGVISGTRQITGGGSDLRTRAHTPGWFTRR